MARGVGSSKMRAGSLYFAHYTRPWISDTTFDPASDPFLTRNQARAIDSAIDQYNAGIVDLVGAGRASGKEWLFLDAAGLVDRLAYRRYIEDPQAQPAWW